MKRTLIVIAVLLLVGLIVYTSGPPRRGRWLRAVESCMATARNEESLRYCVAGRGYDLSDYGDNDEIQQKLLMWRLTHQ